MSDTPNGVNRVLPLLNKGMVPERRAWFMKEGHGSGKKHDSWKKGMAP